MKRGYPLKLAVPNVAVRSPTSKQPKQTPGTALDLEKRKPSRLNPHAPEGRIGAAHRSWRYLIIAAVHFWSPPSDMGPRVKRAHALSKCDLEIVLCPKRRHQYCMALHDTAEQMGSKQ